MTARSMAEAVFENGKREGCPERRVLLLLSSHFIDPWIESCLEEREELKTSARALLSVAVTGREQSVNGNRDQRNSLSTIENAKVEIGAEILLRMGRDLASVLNGC